MDEFYNGLGQAFAEDKIDFECEATSISDLNEFFKVVASCGFEIEGYEEYAKKKSKPAAETQE